jgi:hypothetical protein
MNILSYSFFVSIALAQHLNIVVVPSEGVNNELLGHVGEGYGDFAGSRPRPTANMNLESQKPRKSRD